MTTKLDELAGYIREVIPLPNAVTNLQVKEEIGAVTFGWQGRTFLVKPSLEVLEMRGKNLFITAASTLLFTVLTKNDRSGKVLEAVLEAVAQADDLITIKHRQEAGLKLLGSAKATLLKLSNN